MWVSSPTLHELCIRFAQSRFCSLKSEQNSVPVGAVEG
jgi:hypothetical protein